MLEGKKWMILLEDDRKAKKMPMYVVICEGDSFCY